MLISGSCSWRRLGWPLALLLTALLALAASPAAATTIALGATADGHVNSSLAGLVVDDTNTTVRTSMSGGNNVTHGVYEFDLSSLAGETLTGVQLQIELGIQVSNTNGVPAQVTFLSYAGDGAITTSDFGAVATVQAVESYAVGTPTGTVLTVDFTDLAALQAIVDGSGLLTVRSETVSFVSFWARSLETTAVGALTPTLSVSFVPEPITTALLGCAGLAFAGRRSRTRR